MFVEDVVAALAATLKGCPETFAYLTEWHKSFLKSIADYVESDKALSSNQCHILLPLLRRTRNECIGLGLIKSSELDRLLSKPDYRLTPYESHARVPREVRYLGDNKLCLRCKADPLLTAAIKDLGHAAPSVKLHGRPWPTHFLRGLTKSHSRFDWDHKVWIVPVHRYNLTAILAFLSHYRFDTDKLTSDYLTVFAQNADQPATCVFIDDTRELLHVTVRDDDILAAWITSVAQGVAL